MVYRDPVYGLPAAEDTDVVKTWPTLSRELVDDLAGLFAPIDAADDWVTFNPTLTNANASAMTAAYRRTAGGFLVVSVGFTVTSVSGDIYLAMPAAATITATASAYLKDANGSSYVGVVILNAGSTLAHVYAQRADANYVTIGITSSTVPFTWASGDTVAFTLAYQCAPL